MQTYVAISTLNMTEVSNDSQFWKLSGQDPDESSDPMGESTDQEVALDIFELLENVPQLKQHFLVLDKIGSGTFSTVYLARRKGNEDKQLYALKYIIPTSHPDRILNELHCLRDIGGKENVMGLTCCLRHKDHVVIFMPYFQQDKFSDYVCGLMSVNDVRLYMWHLLKALRHVHSNKMIHRDIKPSNFLFNRKLKQYALVDFGLAQSIEAVQRGDQHPLPKPRSFRASPRKRKSNKSSASESKPKSPRSENQRNAENDSPIFAMMPATPTDTNTKTTLDSSIKTDVDTSLEHCIKSPEPVLGEIQNISLIKNEENDIKEKDEKVKEQRLSKVLSSKENTILSKEVAEIHSATNNLAVSRKDDTQRKETQENISDKRHHSKEPAMKKKHRTIVISPPSARTSQRMRKQVMANKAKHSAIMQAHHKKSTHTSTAIVTNRQGKLVYKSVAPHPCICFGKPRVCDICLSRRPQIAPRAGTPGFRAPEVLLKYKKQSTAVDMWSSGVIMLSLLSWRYPFFKAPDDAHAIAQLMCAFGTNNLQTAARKFGKELTAATSFPDTDLKEICEKLRESTLIANTRLVKLSAANPAKKRILAEFIALEKETHFAMEVNNAFDACSGWDNVPQSAYDLLKRLLDLNPLTRISAADALEHCFFEGL